jgi:hypothetical protein
MVGQESPSDALHGFVKAVRDSLIEPLRKNQVKIAWQKELQESKRYQEAESKIAEFADSVSRLKDNFTLPDKVLEVLHKLSTTRMTASLEMSPKDCEEIRAVLEPYNALVQHVEGIRQLQLTMLAHSKLKKMPLPYDEITATLNEVTVLAGKMPQTLLDSISDILNRVRRPATSSIA